ncbi:DUF5105 domain-containing protein [Listeria fleischmannii]|jgi:hypothetical protein|uniref:Lipoprotein n=3 Tax=Listeria fleischmannii TaxID=1069827 RepID=W7E1H1_9LIST|nr:DUF5105 domain-containing protein [Listeria fleischmannii]EUJ62875.1 lipoprotein [Listeria fleischmannii FSL S10-1203]MBC1398577.1 DUF5105 domain-containing protein [Listeria fleischmannii]MBC1419934.1 DUF5105 domain-containing protein [Listeria fleischmannii]MBC1426638.1 DUF5105 domain-containing protein [Listeria fleischmannii]STY46446.1 Uncharacterised protein [Listeria fleischmannii subsp. coloradonensis]
MKKSFFLVIFGVIFLMLAGCKQPEDAKQAGEALIQSYIYEESTPELKAIFGIDDTTMIKENQNTFVTSIQNQFPEKSKSDLESFQQKVQKHLKKVSSYTIKVENESKEAATLEIGVKGLDTDDESVDNEINKLIAETESKVKADSSEAELDAMINEVSYKGLETMYLESPAEEKAVTVKLELKQNPDDKEKWQIVNEDVFFKNIYEAFGL